MELFANVYLPLPLPGTFTYSVPEDMVPRLSIGKRVYVQFGPRKHYTAVITEVSNVPPEGYTVKPILDVLDDDYPMVRPSQFKLWNWIAEYYLCNPGDVFKAAVPTGLKVESETFVTLNDDYEPNVDNPVQLTSLQESITSMLSFGRKSVKEIGDELGRRNIMPAVLPLMEKGIVCVDEMSVGRYKPETVTVVELTLERGDEEGLHEFFDLVHRSSRQEKALITYLELSQWLNERKDLMTVERKALQEKAGVTPGIVKALVDKGVFRIEKREVNRFKTPASKGEETKVVLSEQQRRAASEIRASFVGKRVTLLHGVTGSGKTEIYLDLINEVLRAGRQVLYLVPEISLTTQLTTRLRRVLGDRLVVYHSRFTDRERVEIWQRLASTTEPLVILGARSSTLLPFSNLGLVIVDEEHESSYKQYDPAPRYNARDTAIVLASFFGAKALLGSATPSVETYYKATTGKYGLVTLANRYSSAPLPDIDIVDMRRQRKEKLNRGVVSQPLALATKTTLEDKGQVIMFQNRRGFSPIVVCGQCGWTPKCVNCDVSLVYHKNTAMLRCHYCGHAQPLPNVCPACGQATVNTFGYGTERIAEEVHQLFPNSAVSRMDLDTTRNKNSYQDIIDDFSAHKTDILVGTQMISKGLDFGGVRTVGVINADTLLNFPDFRSDERAFNMLEQVAGRAGRRETSGRVFIQTTNPSNEVLGFVKNHDYLGFYKHALNDRQKFGYPPFGKIINLYIKHRDSAVTDSLAVEYVLRLRQIFGNRVLGPEKPFVSRVANRYIQQIMLKMEANVSMRKVKEILRQVYEQMTADPRIRSAMIYYDVDPV